MWLELQLIQVYLHGFVPLVTPGLTLPKRLVPIHTVTNGGCSNNVRVTGCVATKLILQTRRTVSSVTDHRIHFWLLLLLRHCNQQKRNALIGYARIATLKSLAANNIAANVDDKIQIGKIKSLV